MADRMNVSFLQELLNSIAEQGRQLLPRTFGGAAIGREDDITELAAALSSNRGEASGVAIARELLHRYRGLTREGRLDFLKYLARTMQPDPAEVTRAAKAYLSGPDAKTLRALQRVVESPRLEFFRRLNLAPGATAEIVAMRRDLIATGDPSLAPLDSDLRHLLASWFNRGFLVLQRIDWRTSANILDKIIAYEAVHTIHGWDDLRRRLDPADRSCFAFFHPSLIDEPLIFVEVALMGDIPAAIGEVLDEAPKIDGAVGEPTTAVFYSISNCQEGLRGISFGNFLIKQVVEDLLKEHPSLNTFVTLSPVPGFADWLDAMLAGTEAARLVTPEERERLSVLSDPDWATSDAISEALRPILLRLAAHYFLTEKAGDGRPLDPVARFHLGNGARLERINWLGDPSAKGQNTAHGLMVNYRYEIRDIERNHEAYANDGVVAASRQVHALLKRPKPRTDLVTGPTTTKLLRIARLRPPSKSPGEEQPEGA
ncbi:MAG TPA: malonyl-CoA decarboxylase [Hyphomicrobiaceae bacterium]|nr:malonyl-CoA decarboxylase [Hyphomicrobiaceae bacterium]